MINFKKIGILGISVLSALAFASKVNADPYWYAVEDSFEGKNGPLTEYKESCGTINEPYKVCTRNATIEVIAEENDNYTGLTGNAKLSYLNSFYGEYSDEDTFKLRIRGVGLEANKNYVVKYVMPEGDVEISETYSSEDLSEGIIFTINKTYGKGSITVTEETATEPIRYLYEDTCAGDPECNEEPITYEKLVLFFSNYYKDFVSIYNGLTKNGVIKLNTTTLDENTPNDIWESKTESLLKDYLPDGYKIVGYYNHYINKTMLVIEKEENDKIRYQNFIVKYVFNNKNDKNSAIVNEVANKLKYNEEDLRKSFDDWFVLKDLEEINYLFNSQGVSMFEEYYLPNYVSKLNKVANNNRISFRYGPEGGFENMFYHGTIGEMNIEFDGDYYKTVDPVGFLVYNIIYVPNDTPKTREAFIGAAQKRINEYLKYNTVVVSYGGKFSDFYSGSAYKYPGIDGYIEFFDMDKTNGEWYNIKIGDKTYPFVIALGSESMNKPYMQATDAVTSIRVEADVAQVPLDVDLKVTHLDPNSEEYKRVAKHVNIINGLAYDIELYSKSLGMKIDKLQNGTFKVYLPLPNEYKLKKLFATYVNEDGKVEFHEVKYENGYGVFTTDHFSIYAITEIKDESTNNPSTGDNVLSNIIILGLSAGAIIILNKKFFFSK